MDPYTNPYVDADLLPGHPWRPLTPKDINRIEKGPHGEDLVVGPSKMSDTGVLVFPGWAVPATIDDAQAEENTKNAEALLQGPSHTDPYMDPYMDPYTS